MAITRSKKRRSADLCNASVVMDTDASASTENTKKRKMFEGQKNGEKDDIISNLPNNVLHYILSFLPTKFAVGTSILSPRWKCLWTSIHNFEFCEKLYENKKMGKMTLKRRRAFIQFVDRVLLSNSDSNIQKFSLNCMECDAIHFNKWMSTIIRRKVQELILIIEVNSPNRLPDCVLTYNLLKTLKVEMRVIIEIPHLLCFSSLKVLHLKDVTFLGNHSTNEISESYSLLEELVLCCCTWLDIKTVNISAPTLQVLELEDSQCTGLRDCDCLVKIYADSILSLKMKGLRTNEYCVVGPSSRGDTSIRVNNYGAFRHPSRFPPCLFACETLRVLKIIKVCIDIPTSICLSSIKVLHLIDMAFSCDRSICESSLSLPILEELVFHDCMWSNIKTVNISAPTLKILNIEGCKNLGLHDWRITIKAESLTSLKLNSYYSDEYFLFDPSSLLDASIDVVHYKDAYLEGSLLRGIHHVKGLELSANSIVTLSHLYVSTRMLTFSRLTHLRVLRKYPLTLLSGKTLIDFLSSMPNLEYLYFPGGVDVFKFHGHGRIFGTTPQCYLSHLKSVHITYFSWTGHELWFVKFLMKSITVMDKLCFKLLRGCHFPRRYNAERDKRTTEKLERLARDSNCVIEFA